MRLVVGTINLVEKIAQLAQIRETTVDKLSGKELKSMKEVELADTVVRLGAGALGLQGPPARLRPCPTSP